MHAYICDSDWPDIITTSLVNLLSRKWTFQDTADSEDIDLHDELREFLFVRYLYNKIVLIVTFFIRVCFMLFYFT